MLGCAQRQVNVGDDQSTPGWSAMLKLTRHQPQKLS